MAPVLVVLIQLMASTVIPTQNLCQSSHFLLADKLENVFLNTKPKCQFFVTTHSQESIVVVCSLSASHVVVAGWEDEDVLIVGYTEEPPRKRRKVTDEGVWMQVEDLKSSDLLL